jgi:hypothetical protein
MFETSPDKTAVPLQNSTVSALLHQHSRSLKTLLSTVKDLFPLTTKSTSILSTNEISLGIVTQHLSQLVNEYSTGLDDVDDLVRNQLIASIGKTITPQDFAAYMKFHNQRLLNT